MPTLTIAFPAKFQIHARFAMTLIEVVDALKSMQTEWTIKTHYILGKSNLSHARSVIVTEWYETAADNDGFFFIDTDHTFTAEDILRVIAQEGDLNCGIYCNRAKDPVCFPLGGVWPDQVDNIPLKYAATGFLFFRKAALVRIHEWMKEKEGLDRVVISDFPGHIEQRTIPFFHSIMEPPRADGKRFWLGEDFSFSWRAVEAGLKLRGCITYTLGHEIPYVVFNDKPRRAPRIWLPTAVVVYAGPTLIPAPVIQSLVQALAPLGKKVLVYSAAPSHTFPALEFHRYEEFYSQDTFSTLLLWGETAITTATSTALPKAHQLCLYLDTKAMQISQSITAAHKILVPSQEIYDHYTSLFIKEGQMEVTAPESIGGVLRQNS